ncbi:MAG: DUF2695 domain-containing protein [Clostridiales bacterium]|nr:DUF2695 domain-containing protein [Clostridiales bacterium]
MNDQSRMMKMERQTQKRVAHILSANQAADLFAYLDIRLQEEGCNHTHRFTQGWLDDHVSFMQHDAVLTELEDMGGYCDCEVLRSCYEDYEL